MRHTVIIGGGITGLATAFHLQRSALGSVAVTLIESSPRLGGKISSSRQDGFLIEGGPDSFLARKHSTLEMCRDLGLETDLIGTSPAEHSTFVLSQSRLHPLPTGPGPLLKSNLLSRPAKLRLAAEPLIPARRDPSDESLAAFIRRRMGAEVLDKLAAPLLAGIYAADPERLSLQSTFAMLPSMEQKYGSLLRGYLASRRQHRGAAPQPASDTGRSMFTTLRSGLSQLVDVLAQHLTFADIRLSTSVLAVMPIGGHYEVLLHNGSWLRADDVVFATPAYVTADLLEEFDSELARHLRGIRYVSTATVSLGFHTHDLSRPLNGYGFVVPRQECRLMSACTWSSAKFADRAPQGFALLRVFLGGARNERIAEQEEAALIDLARYELRAAMGIAAHPVVAKASRWVRGNPQYDVGHLDRVAAIDRLAARHPGLYLAGAAYRGAGLPDCIESGARVASRIAQSASTGQPAASQLQEHVYG